MAVRTDDEEDSINVKKAVRTFSWKTYAEDPDDDLTKSLVVAEAITDENKKEKGTLRDQWMQIFDPISSKPFHGSQDDIILARPTDELSQAYKKFLKCLPKTNQARIEDGPPRLEVVFDALTFAEATWKNNREKTKAGRMRGLFSKVAVNFNKFKELFAVIPDSNIYVSLVAGCISAIVKATVNHEKIAESVSTALDDLSDDIAYWKEYLESSEHTIRAEHYISKLYVEVFKFLATIMVKWSSKSSVARLFRSFDSEFFKAEIEDKKSRIWVLENKLRRQLELATACNTNNIISKVQSLADAQANFQAQWLMFLGQQQLILGQTVKDSLEEQCRNQQREQRESALRTQLCIASRTTSSKSPSPMSEYPESFVTYYTTAQIQLSALQQLRSYTAQQHILSLMERSPLLKIHIEIFNRIQQWNAACTPQTLWIQGPFQVPQPSRYTQLSAYVIMIAQKANIPVLYHFCDSATSLVDLLYSLIAQLVRVLPENLQSQKDFSSARFEALDKTSSSIDHAILLFKDLLAIDTSVLFIVIDGFQMVQNSSSSSTLIQIQDFINIFRDAGKDKDEKSDEDQDCIITKTLFTTDGFTDALMHLSSAERMSGIDFSGEDDAGPELDGIEVGFLRI